MQIELSEQDQKLVDRLVSSGRFQSPEDVINAGLSVLQEHERWLEYVRTSIDEGMDAAERGDFVEQEEVEKLLQSYMRKSA